MEFTQVFRAMLTMSLFSIGRLVSVWVWMMGARFRVLRKAAGWRKAAQKAAQKLERETGKRLQKERELAEARAARDVAQEMLRQYMSQTQGYMQDMVQWAGRQAVGYGPGEPIPEHLVKSAPVEPKAPKLTARQIAMKMTEEALYGHSEQ